MSQITVGRLTAIPHRGKMVPVWVLSNSLGIYRNLEGVFLRRWERNEDGNTPSQRAQKKYGPNDVDYAFYPLGITSAGRSRAYALEQGYEQFLPTLQEFLQLFDCDLRLIFVRREEVIPQLLRKKLFRSGYIFESAKTPEGKEAYAKIMCLVHDIKTKSINVGAYLARVTAISDRIRERLNDIYGWTAIYSAQRQFLAAIYVQFNRVLERLEELELREKGFLRQIAGGGAMRLSYQVSSVSKDVARFHGLQPFDKWAVNMSHDLDDAAKYLKSGNLGAACPVMERLGLALEIKRKQQEIDFLLLRMGQDAILRRCDRLFYARKISALMEFFRSKIETERKLKFKDPVCSNVVVYLTEANKCFQIKETRTLLKSAYELL